MISSASASSAASDYTFSFYSGCSSACSGSGSGFGLAAAAFFLWVTDTYELFGVTALAFALNVFLDNTFFVTAAY